MAHPGPLLVLWQVELPHYNEKVRWVLDLKRIDHVRRPLVPGGRRTSTCSSRPDVLPALDHNQPPVARALLRAISRACALACVATSASPPPPPPTAGPRCSPP